MSTPKVIKHTGKLILGPVEHAPATPLFEAAALVEYIEIDVLEGDAVLLSRVLVPPILWSMLKSDSVCTLHLLEVPMPKLFFGIKPLYILFAVEVDGKVRKAIEPARGCLRVTKFSALKLFGCGLLLLPVYGFGLLFIVMAIRLWSISFPAAQMTAAVG